MTITAAAKTPAPHFPLGGVGGEFELASNGRKLTLLRPFLYIDGALSVEVPAGFVTDFNSVPRLAWIWFPPWECPEAGVVHDWLYRHPGGRARADVDAIHRRIMEIQGERAMKRQAVYLAIRAGGWSPWGEYRRAEA